MADTLYQQIADDLRAQIESGSSSRGSSWNPSSSCGSDAARPGTQSATPSGG